MKIDNLRKNFSYINENDIEKMILDSIQMGFVNCKIDYRKNVIRFNQNMESDCVRFNLQCIQQNFLKLIKSLYPEEEKQLIQSRQNAVDQLKSLRELERKKYWTDKTLSKN